MHQFISHYPPHWNRNMHNLFELSDQCVVGCVRSVFHFHIIAGTSGIFWFNPWKSRSLSQAQWPRNLGFPGAFPSQAICSNERTRFGLRMRWGWKQYKVIVFYNLQCIPTEYFFKTFCTSTNILCGFRYLVKTNHSLGDVTNRSQTTFQMKRNTLPI